MMDYGSSNGHSEMISFGAGVNSVTMTIMLVNDGWRGPIVFADPGAEHPDTYCYIEYFEREWLRPHGLEVVRINAEDNQNLYGKRYRGHCLEQLCVELGIVPLVMSRWCTAEYKRRPLTKWAQQHDIEVHLIGISYEERHRASRSKQGGRDAEYPLVDRKISRDQCKAIIEAHGLTVPPKSGCWFCPFQRVPEWRRLYDLRPDLFERAVQIENTAMQKASPGYEHEPILGVNCGMALERARQMWDAQLELPLMPEPEYEYQMCECRL